VLYRAFSGGYKTLKELGIHDVRKNRNPVDTPLEIHLMTDEAFYKKFNLKPRSESLFCSKSLKVAENYANSIEDVYIIIPKETDIKYVYSTKIRDFLTSSVMLIRLI